MGFKRKKIHYRKAFDILDKDEIGKTASKFDKIKEEFKQIQREKLHQDFKDNQDAYIKSGTDFLDAFNEMKNELEQSRKREEENDKNKGFSR